MKNRLLMLIAVVALFGVACTPQTVEVTRVVTETETVTEEVQVEVTREVEVETEVVVEKEVEVETIVEVERELTNRGTLRIAHDMSWGGTEELNPVSESRFGPPTWILFEGLTNLVDGKPVPNLAKSWEANEDASVWTIHLREGVLFHSGTEMTSADVIYSVNHWKTPPSIAATNFAIVESVEAVDDYTVQFNLAQGFADFPFSLTNYQAVVIEDGTAENLYDPDSDKSGSIIETGNGTGAFKLETLDVEGVTVLVANDNYWAGPPGIAKITVTGIADSAAQLNAFLAGELDFHDMNADDAALVEAQGGLDIVSFPVGGWDAFVMRVDVPPFDNPDLRRALRVGVNRQEMLDVVLGPGNGVVTCDTPVKPDDQYRWETDCASGDQELAAELLAAAGYGGETLTLHYSDVCANWAPMAEVYQQQMAELGVNIELEVVPSDGYWSDVWQTEAFTATCWGERVADQILNEAYRSGASWSDTFYANPEFDAALDAARAELDFEARRDLYHSAQAMLYHDSGTLIPFHATLFRGTSQCVVGMTPVSLFYIPYASMSVTPGCE